MVVMRKQLITSLADLRFVCLECPQCHTKVTLDMDAFVDLSWPRFDHFIWPT